MTTSDAVELIRGAIPRPGGIWADLGAGDGLFTRALVDLLGPTARIYAVDRDRDSIAELERWAEEEGVLNVTPVRADFAGSFELPGSDAVPLDGLLLANSLHFVRDATEALARLGTHLRPGGRVVLVEYDRRAPSRWVPYPIPLPELPAILRSAGFSEPVISATRPSIFGGSLYAAAADWHSSG